MLQNLGLLFIVLEYPVSPEKVWVLFKEGKKRVNPEPLEGGDPFLFDSRSTVHPINGFCGTHLDHGQVR